MQIEFDVDGQRLIRTSEAYIIEGSENFVECVFNFSNDWDNLTKYALFHRDLDSYKIHLVNGKCLVPVQCTFIEGEFSVQVIGENNYDVVVLATTQEKLLNVRQDEASPKISYFEQVKLHIEEIEKSAALKAHDSEKSANKSETSAQSSLLSANKSEQMANYVDEIIEKNTLLMENISLVDGAICITYEKEEV